MHVREETASDWPAVARVIEDAFGGVAEVELVRRLRRDGLIALALVAEIEGELVGHIVLSWLEAEIDGRRPRVLGLAPLGVRSDRQRRGVGSRLVDESISRARRLGADAIIVLGHPSYYPRFGFSAALAATLKSPFSGEAFMALEIVPGALSGTSGSVRYPSAFGL
jgi:putative acetyltransferase